MKILCITPINHIKNLKDRLSKLGQLTQLIDPTRESVIAALRDKYDVIFTNPNKQRFVIDAAMLRNSNIRVIATASTGTNHIDIDACSSNGIAVISLMRELDVINNITSTAELALALSLAIVRNVPAATRHTEEFGWNYEPFIGRQLSQLTLGVVGYGRLGKMMCKMASCIFKNIIVYDPYVSVVAHTQAQSLCECLEFSDVVSLHVHLDSSTRNMINMRTLQMMKPKSYLVNTSRGAVVDEFAVLHALDNGILMGYATDVICDELGDIQSSVILNNCRKKNIIVTPHIGGMTVEAQSIAYHAIVEKLENYFAC
jgi:D-3-phosphoglycerate dehydrogenase